MTQAKCLSEYGWEKKVTGTGCQRKRPASTDEYQSLARLEMPANPEISLKDHQTRIAEKLKDQKGLIVFHGLGSGKTLTAINAAEDYGGAIVVTPASLQDNFKKELETYGAKGKYDVYSYEKFLRDKPDTKGRMLIVDEAHRVRNSATKGYKAIAAGAEGAEKVLLLTATPIQNKPHELAPLVNIAANKKVLPLSEKEFRNQYIKQEGVPFWQRPFVPANVHSIDKPKNLEEFNREVSKYVDHYAPTKEGYPSVVENTVEVPMTKAQVQAYKFFEEKLDPITKYKMKNNLPLDKQESSNLNAFINAQRQVANTEKAFDVTARGRSPKTIEIADRIQGGKGKALVYSNFLDSGIKDLSKELGDRRISHRVYTGKLTRKEKDQIIADYNNEKFKVLIVSSAGGEGLDLKRTRQVHIMEPHWNEEKIAQVMGRAIRYKSHEGLPPRDQNVETYQYVSVFPKNFFGFKSGQVTADEYLTALGRKKKALNDQFLGVVKADALYFDAKCGKGWEGAKGRCKRSKLKPEERTRRQTKLVIGAAIGITGLALTGAAVIGRNLYEVDKNQPKQRETPPANKQQNDFPKDIQAEPYPEELDVLSTEEVSPSLREKRRSGDIISRKGVSEIFDWAIDNGTPLTHVEKAAIDHYRGSGHRDINNRLKGREVKNPVLQDYYIANLDEALDRIPPFTGEHSPIGETFRAEGDDYVDYPVFGKAEKLIRVTKKNKDDILSLYKEGDVVKEDGYLSTATFLSNRKMDVFAGNGNYGYNATVVYEIKWKKEGTAARWVTESNSVSRDENEVLFKRGTSFRVSGVKENDYKLNTAYGYKIILEEV